MLTNEFQWVVYNTLMLPIQKSKNLVQQVQRITHRMQNIKQVKKQLFDFTTEVQQLYSTFSQKIHKQMIFFEEEIVKNSLYSTDKTSYVINMAKVYRQFTIQLQKNSKINIVNLQRIKGGEIVSKSQNLQKKCDLFIKEFSQYLETEKKYNNSYKIYSDKCNILDEVIKRYRTYQNPIAFYNQILTNQYINQLDKNYNQCSNQETVVLNETQRLDQTRKWMTEHIKEISQHYLMLLHAYLYNIENLIHCIVDPKKNQQNLQNFEKKGLGLRNSEIDSVDIQHRNQLQKLNQLYTSQINNKRVIQDNLVEQYSDLFKQWFTQSQINSDYNFFYDRCQNIRSKKLKTTDQVFKIQKMLIGQLNHQVDNYKEFQKNYREIEKDIFTNNGIDSFKKKFRKYFGSNFTEINQLCLVINERQKKTLEKIGKSTEDNREKLSKLLQSKQQSIKFFQKRTKAILQDHLKLKSKTFSKNSQDSQQIKLFKENVSQSFNQLKKSFMQLEKNQFQIDKLFHNNLKSHYELILKEAANKSLAKLLQKEKNRLNILNQLNINSQTVLILKEDSRYQMLLNQCPKPNLFSSFKSLIKKEEYNQTKKLLQRKENTLKNMIRSKKGCCGVTSEPLKNNVATQHTCKLINQKKLKGILSITTTGVIFQESSWNPFCDVLRLMVPASDMIKFDERENSNQKKAVQIATQFGSLIFQSKQCKQIIQSMQKNIVFKPAPNDCSDRLTKVNKSNESSSFIKNSTQSQFKVTFDKTISNTAADKTKSILKGEKNQAKSKNFETVWKEFIKKWKQSNSFSNQFIIIPKKGQQGDKRRDYSFKSGHSKFYLRERRDYLIQGKDIALTYQWKISFPDSPMLHSFKHSQKVIIQGVMKDPLRVKIIMGKLCQEQLFIKDRFYKEIEKMNNELCNFVANTFERSAEVNIQAENDDNKSLQSCNIIVDEINVEDRDSKYGDSTLRNSRLERQKSQSFGTSNGFKTS